jgi:hypothetical protein
MSSRVTPSTWSSAVVDVVKADELAVEVITHDPRGTRAPLALYMVTGSTLA